MRRYTDVKTSQGAPSNRNALQPSFSPDAAGGRAESASHTTVKLCARHGFEQGDVQGDVTANPSTLMLRSSL
jgi:hypothetical protein